MFLLSILAYLLFFTLLFLILKGDREKQLLALLLVNILFYINIGLIEKPELTPYQLLPYLFFIKEAFFNFHQFKKQLNSFPIKFGLGFIFLAYFATCWSNGGNLHDYYEVFRYCFDKYVPIIAVFICAKEVEEKSLVRHLFLFFPVFCGMGFVEYLLNHNYVREAIATAFPSTRVSDMFGPAGITNGFGSSGWRTRISITTKHPTVLGVLLSTMFLFSLSYLKVSQNQFDVRKRNLVLFSIAFTTILSGSRTAMGCLGLGLLIYFTVSLSFKKKLLAIILYAVAFYGLSSAATAVFSAKEGGSSLELRQQQLLFTVIEFANKPLFGHGLYYTNHTILATDDDGKRVNFDKEETQGLESIVLRSSRHRFVWRLGFVSLLWTNTSVFFQAQKRTLQIGNAGNARNFHARPVSDSFRRNRPQHGNLHSFYRNISGAPSKRDSSKNRNQRFSKIRRFLKRIKESRRGAKFLSFPP